MRSRARPAPVRGASVGDKILYLARHGAVGRRYAGRFIGRTDAPLSEAGRRQARRLAHFFRGRSRSAVLSSPLRRAAATARLAHPAAKRPRLWPALREIDFGRWEGLTFEEIRRRDPALVRRWARFARDFAFPSGESLRSFAFRLRRVEKRLLRFPAREVLVVSHGGVIRSLLCRWTGLPARRYPEIRVRPGSLSAVRVRNGRPRVLFMDRRPG